MHRRVVTLAQVNTWGWLARDAAVAVGMAAAADRTLPDVMVFTETWLPAGQDAPVVPGYVGYNFARPGADRHRGGGIAVYICVRLATGCRVVFQRNDASFVVLRFADMWGGGSDLVLVACYIPPVTSPYYDDGVWDDLHGRVEDAYGWGEVLVVGDLNARTGVRPDFPQDELGAALAGDTLGRRGIVPTSAARASQDADGAVNASGRRLLELCRTTGMRIANGRSQGDATGALTFLGGGAARGGSLLDYVLASPLAFFSVAELRVLPAPESDHACVHLQIRLPAPALSPHGPPLTRPPRMAGTERLVRWASLLETARYQARIREIVGAADAAAATADGQALAVAGAMFDTLLSESWQSTPEEPSGGRRRAGAMRCRWWSRDLGRLRNAARQAWHRDPRSPAAYACRTAYQGAARRARGRYLRQQGAQLGDQFFHEPGRFWKSYQPGSKSPLPVSVPDLTAHFRNLLGQPGQDVSLLDLPRGPGRVLDDLELDFRFCDVGVEAGIHKMKRGKATVGLLTVDALQVAAPVLSACIAALFNACCDAGCLPGTWALCQVSAVHKAGDPTAAANYRGLAVGTPLAKLYASLLRELLDPWTERHGLRAWGQAGFRWRHGTTDQALVLRTLIESARAQRRPLFTCFVDFQKAYDTIPRARLWRKLERLGVHARMLRAIQALYADVPMLVRGAPEGSVPFQSRLGLKQGCPLSPLLFGLYVDDYEGGLLAESEHHDLPRLGNRAVPPPFFADDLVHVSLSNQGLQRQMEYLSAYANANGMCVNINKTKAMVFRSGARTPDFDISYEGGAVEVVQAFKYLGIVFHSTHAFSADAGEARAAAAARAQGALRRRCYQLGIQDPTLQMRLHDMLVRPSLLYGVEVWGPNSLGAPGSKIDKVHRDFLRRVLGARSRASTDVVMAELGRFPLAVDAKLQLARFWNRLDALPGDRLVKCAFQESLRLSTLPAARGRLPWAAEMAAALGIRIDDPDREQVGPEGVRDQAKAAHVCAVVQSGGPAVQRYIRATGPMAIETYRPAKYLTQVRHSRARRCLAQLRSGSHWLREETGRWVGLPRRERLCARCGAAEIDDAFHMALRCTALADIHMRHADLLRGVQSLAELYQRPPARVAAFVLECRDRCRELDENDT